MMLTNENYFSPEMNKKYMSVSQFKSFQNCESMALAELNGEYERERTPAMLVGSYVDAHFSKELDLFKAKNPEIFTMKGDLKSEFKHANYIIERIERDPFFMKYLNGETQKIVTGEIAGVPFKAKFDIYHPGKAIVDLKVMRSFEREWKDNIKLNFIEFWQYDIQGAVYRELEGNRLPFIIAAATKEREPDLEVIGIPHERLDFCLEIVKQTVGRFNDLKHGIGEPTRCEKCDWCKRTKILNSVISWESVGA